MQALSRFFSPAASFLTKLDLDLDQEITLGQKNPKFLKGAATSMFQDSGSVNCPDSHWVEWEKKVLPDAARRSQASANLYTLYQTPYGRKEITDRLKKLGANSYRFSIEWSHIQPKKGQFLTRVMQVYVNFCKHLRNHGIRPMITLHHFSEPTWFHELGSFEKEENIPFFVEFAKKAFTVLTQKYRGALLVEHFCTINEPSIEATGRYVGGEFSPGLSFRYERCAHFLKGALKAHVAAYQALKPIEPKAQIGITHNYFKFVPTNRLFSLLTHYQNRFMNDAVLNFFKDGKFELKVPLLCNVQEQLPKPPTDFIGLQYYLRLVVGITRETAETKSIVQWPEDPDGIYDAILAVHDAFKVPVIITENGVSTSNEETRARYFHRVLLATQKAEEVIGSENLQGYHVWSFCDSSEWAHGIDAHHMGAFAVTKINGKRILAEDPKPGMAPFIKMAKK